MDKQEVKGKCLAEYRVEVWLGLVFVSVNPDVESLAPGLEALADRLQPYDLAAYTVVHRAEGEFECNWKVLVENFCESYHVFSVHKNTLEINSPTRTTKVLEGGPGFNHHTMTALSSDTFSDESLARLPSELVDIGHLICIYPCLAFSIDPEMALWLTVRPTGTLCRSLTKRFIERFTSRRAGRSRGSSWRIFGPEG
ncbi:MAG: SRPBCC family protein [Myxococcales bacterium]|nr:hypothetical protein [Myxococcales bacterium]HIK84095.1 hypothetical protein [Myxococcales bacterium]